MPRFLDMHIVPPGAVTPELVAELAAAQGRREGAVRLAAAATSLHDRAGAPLTPSGRARLDRALEPARELLSPEAADAALQAGSALDVDEAVTAALASTELSAPAGGRRPPSAPGSSDVRSDVRSALTRREEEVAVLIAHGLTNRQIAEALVITEGTIANHIVHILSKLGYRSRAQVAVWAAEHRLISTSSGA